jgi:hypothetical protein
MVAPSDDVQIPASGTNWTVGPLTGTATKAAPTAGQLADGLVGGQSLKSRIWNYIENTNARWLEFLRTEANTAKFGDGSDGAVVQGAGTLTLTRDMYYTDLTLSDAASVVASDGERIFCSGTYTMVTGATARNNGVDTVVANRLGANGAPNRASVSLTRALLGGGDGADGPNTSSTAGTQASSVVFRQGGGGGGGGDDGQGNAGGNAQGSASLPASVGGYRHYPECVTRRFVDPLTSTFAALGGGVGGSSGGNASAGGNQHGGPGGGGAGALVIVARRIVLASGAVLSAVGGAGGDGVTAATGAGGGGGGGGGVIVLITRDLQDAGATITVAGGLGGTGKGTGSPGADGGVGVILSLTG